MKTLIFEGAGWAGADSSKATNVGNCRIRTKLRNRAGRVIYLELGQTFVSDPQIYIDFCFYADSEWDSRRSISNGMPSRPSSIHSKYSKEGIIAFVNETLDCDFDSMEVINDYSVSAFQDEPLCNCALDGYTPYADPTLYIFELDGVMSLNEKDKDHGFARYKIPYRFVKKHLKWWFEDKDQKEIERIRNDVFYVALRWFEDGKIYNAEISSNNQSFPSFGIGIETAKAAINEVLKSVKKVAV